jgi:hypothetical protein
LGVVVAIVKLRMSSPAGERQVSYNPAIAISPRPAVWNARQARARFR